MGEAVGVLGVGLFELSLLRHAGSLVLQSMDDRSRSSLSGSRMRDYGARRNLPISLLMVECPREQFSRSFVVPN